MTVATAALPRPWPLLGGRYRRGSGCMAGRKSIHASVDTWSFRLLHCVVLLLAGPSSHRSTVAAVRHPSAAVLGTGRECSARPLVICDQPSERSQAFIVRAASTIRRNLIAFDQSGLRMIHVRRPHSAGDTTVLGVVLTDMRQHSSSEPGIWQITIGWCRRSVAADRSFRGPASPR